MNGPLVAQKPVACKLLDGEHARQWVRRSSVVVEGGGGGAEGERLGNQYLGS